MPFESFLSIQTPRALHVKDGYIAGRRLCKKIRFVGMFFQTSTCEGFLCIKNNVKLDHKFDLSYGQRRVFFIKEYVLDEDSSRSCSKTKFFPWLVL